MYCESNCRFYWKRAGTEPGAWYVLRFLKDGSLSFIGMLGAELEDVVCKKYGMIDYVWGISGASTDFVSYLLSLCSLTDGILFIREISPIVQCPFWFADTFSSSSMTAMPSLHPGFCVSRFPLSAIRALTNYDSYTHYSRRR